MNKAFLTLLFFVGAAAAQPVAATQTSATPPPAFNSVRASTGYRNALTQVATRYEQGLSTHCVQVELQLQQMQAKVYGPFQLNEKGDILSATWKESTPGIACEQTRLYNAMVLIRQGKPQVLALFPGHSYAGPQLQHDAILYANAATGAGKDCPADIIDTALLNGEPTGPQIPWDEKWILRACGKRYSVTLHFIPDATGTTIRSGFRETVVLP